MNIHVKRPVSPLNEASRIDIGQQIYRARTRKGITQEQLARTIHAHGGKLCPTQLTSIEQGDYSVRFDDLTDIARALGMKVVLVEEE